MSKISKKGMIRIILASILIAMLVITMTAPQAMAASGGTKKMTVYNEVIKKGKYAYCSAYHGIYKVNLKTGTKKRLVAFNDRYGNYDLYAEYMAIRKGYLYYIDYWVINGHLHRVKISGKGKKSLGQVNAYAIKGNKLYYTRWSDNGEKILKKRMKLNGKKKRKSSFNVDNKVKKTNAKGYRVKSALNDSVWVYDYQGGGYIVTEYYTQYLVKPSGKRIKLCDYTSEHVE